MLASWYKPPFPIHQKIPRALKIHTGSLMRSDLVWSFFQLFSERTHLVHEGQGFHFLVYGFIYLENYPIPDSIFLLLYRLEKVSKEISTLNNKQVNKNVILSPKNKKELMCWWQVQLPNPMRLHSTLAEWNFSFNMERGFIQQSPSAPIITK